MSRLLHFCPGVNMNVQLMQDAQKSVICVCQPFNRLHLMVLQIALVNFPDASLR